MKNLSLKLLVGVLALFIGISMAWARGVFKAFSFSLTTSTLSSADKVMPTSEPPVREKSGKVQLHFKGFEQSKDWIAHFEIVNDTAQPIIYVGHPRKDNFSFCTLAARRYEQFMQSGYATRYNCIDSTYVGLQTIESGKSIHFSIFKNEVRDMLRSEASESKTNAQFGFEFFVGDEKRKEMLWSEEITFPNDVVQIGESDVEQRLTPDRESARFLSSTSLRGR